MSEVATTTPNPETPIVTVTATPFSGNAWSETPPEPKKEDAPPVTTIVSTDKTVVAPTPDPKETSPAVISEWYKEYNWENEETAKNEIAELRKLKEAKAAEPEVKYLGIPDDKEEEWFNYVHNKRTLSKIENANLDNSKEAGELLKTYYRFKYKDFTDNEIIEHFNETYEKPDKPKQSVEQTDEDYAELLTKWQARIDAIDRKIVRDAKMVKPDFIQFKTNLVAPELPKPVLPNGQPSKEDLEKLEQIRSNFLNKLESDFSKAEGFATRVKDESVDIPVSFKIPEDERVAIKSRLKDGFSVDEYFNGRWFEKDGTPKIDLIISDIYELENRDKVHSGLVNNAANQRLVEYRKEIGNIDITKTPQQTFDPTKQTGAKNVSPFSKNAWSEQPPVMINN